MTESERITACLQAAQPTFVRDFRIALGDDHNGDPSLWVWVVLDDEAFDGPSLLQRSDAANDWIHAAVAVASSDRFPYVRLRSVTDEAA
jgi:hypothetical protein